MKYIRQLDKYCVGYRNEVLSIYAPGNGLPGNLSRRYIKATRSIFLHSKEGYCLRLALVNAVERLGGLDDMEKLLHMGPVQK